MAPVVPDITNFMKVIQEAFGEQWRDYNFFGYRQGGFGSVFLLEKGGERFCLKIQNEPKNPAEAAEFHREATLSDTLSNTFHLCSACNVIQCSDPSSKELAWILYEYIPGCSLYDLIYQNDFNQNPESDLLIMKALISSYKTIVYFNTQVNPVFCHRDINPKNIMMDADGIAYIIDFGQSRAERAGEIMQSNRNELRGTAAYRPAFAIIEDVVRYRTIYDITGWARTFISVVCHKWLENVKQIRKFSGPYYNLLKTILENDDNIELDCQDYLNGMIQEADTILKEPQLTEFRDFARNYNPCDPIFHHKTPEYFEKAKQKNLIFKCFEPENLGVEMDRIAAAGSDLDQSTEFNTYITSKIF